MASLTADLLRRRAEHNNGQLSTLQELALHGQFLESIDLLGTACRNLRILLLQNNVIGKIHGLHRLKNLEYLNLAINNLCSIEGLSGCESLQRLDLTLNFIGLSSLPTVAHLSSNWALRELHLQGNPCAKWTHYRPYVIAVLPQLTHLDGGEITSDERTAALAVLPELSHALATACTAVEPGEACLGDLHQRGWTPQSRLDDARRQRALIEQRDAQREGASVCGEKSLGAGPSPAPLLAELPDLAEDAPLFQKNEGQWKYTLVETDNFVQVELELERQTCTTQLRLDVRPRGLRLLVAGRLLQLRLPAEVVPSCPPSTASRSLASGRLVLLLAKREQHAARRAAPTVLRIETESTDAGQRESLDDWRRSEASAAAGGRSACADRGLGSAPLPIPPPKVALCVGSTVGWRLMPGPEVSTPPLVARLAGTSPDPYAHLRRASRDCCALEPIKESFQPRVVAKCCALEGGVHAAGRPGMQACAASDVVPPPRFAQ